MDALTRRILQQVEALPARKKAAVLERLREETARAPAHDEDEQAAWKASLLGLSAWTDEELHGVEEARVWLNRWTPKS